MGVAQVHASNGGSVNVRKVPGGAVIAKVPSQTIVETLGEYDAEWTKVSYNNQHGYMMSQFLVPAASDEDKEDVVLTLPRDVAEMLLAALSGVVGG